MRDCGGLETVNALSIDSALELLRTEPMAGASEAILREIRRNEVEAADTGLKGRDTIIKQDWPL